MERNSGEHGMNLGSRKLVVLGIPWDVDTEGLRQYMLKFGELDDVIVMKDRSTGRSRGFGYVTFAAVEDAKKAVSTQHSLNGRMLEVKVATPKEDMKPPAKKITRVFVARIPPTVTDELFRNYFEKYGTLTDAYMPKDQGSKAHRGIGFVTFENPDSVDRLMNETHELGGSTIAVDRATPKEDGNKSWGRGFHGGNSNSGSGAGSGAYGAYGVYTAARFGGFGGGFGAYDYSGSGLGSDLGPSGGLSSAYGGGNSWPPAPPGGGYGGPGLGIPGGGSGSYGSGGPPVPPLRGLGTKIFVGRLPPEANADDLRRYFNNFGRISDVYVPKDAKKTSHRGFGFVTFSDEGAAERVALRSHEILGHQIAVDRAAPQDEMSNISYMNSVGGLGSLSQGAGGPMRGSNAPLQGSGYGSLSGNLDFSSGWGGYGGVGGLQSSLDSGLPGGHRSSSMNEIIPIAFPVFLPENPWQEPAMLLGAPKAIIERPILSAETKAIVEDESPRMATIWRPPTPDGDEERALKLTSEAIKNIQVVESEKKGRLEEYLRVQIIECRWAAELKAECMAIKNRPVCNSVTVDEVVHRMTIKSPAIFISDNEKAELVERIRALLSTHPELVLPYP